MHSDACKSLAKVFQTLPNEQLEAVFKDIRDRIKKTLNDLPNKPQKAEFRRFLTLLNGNDDVVAPTSNAAFLFFWFFYLTHYKKCPSKRNFPSPCNYEIIIPCSETNEKFMKFYLVPSGMDKGDTAVCFFSHLKIGEMNPEHKKTVDRQVHVKPKDLNEFAGLHKIDLFKTAKEMNDMPMGAAFLTLLDVPFLRLPCYNLPYQCLYEMISDWVGDFWIDNTAIFNSAIAKGQTNVTLRRKNINTRYFLALALHPIWALFDYYNQERLDHLNMVDNIAHKLENEKSKILESLNIPSLFMPRNDGSPPEELAAFIKSSQRLLERFLKAKPTRKVINKAK